MTGGEPQERELEKELSGLLNRHLAENASDTPDFILAEFLIRCLEAWNKGVCARRDWHGDSETTDQWRNATELGGKHGSR